MSKIILERSIREEKDENGKSYFSAKLGDWDAVIDETLCLAFKGSRIPYFLSGKIPHFIEGAEVYTKGGVVYIKPSSSYNLFIIELDYDCYGRDELSLSPIDRDKIDKRIDFYKLSDDDNRFFDTVGSVIQTRFDSLVLKKVYHGVRGKGLFESFYVKKTTYLYLDADGIMELDFLLK